MLGFLHIPFILVLNLSYLSNVTYKRFLVLLFDISSESMVMVTGSLRVTSKGVNDIVSVYEISWRFSITSSLLSQQTQRVSIFLMKNTINSTFFPVEIQVLTFWIIFSLIRLLLNLLQGYFNIESWIKNHNFKIQKVENYCC